MIAAALVGAAALASLISVLATCWIEWRWRGARRLGKRGRLRGADSPGPEPAVVYLHGLYGSGRCFALVRARLQGRLRQIALDRPGAGASGGAALPLERESARVLACLDHLGVQRAILVGCRDGAALALQIALSRPGLAAGLALSAPLAANQKPERGGRVFVLAQLPLLGSMLAHFTGVWTAAAIRARTRRLRFGAGPAPTAWSAHAGEALALRPGALHQAARAERLAQQGREGLLRGLGALAAPVILLTEGRAAARDDARLLAQLAPRAEIIVVPASGRMPHASSPAALAAAVLRLAALEAARAAPYASADS